MSDAGDVTRLLRDWSYGNQEALSELMPLVYRELRGLAAAYLRRERRDHTLQPTALVHEAYLRLVDQSEVDCRTRTHFFGIAANLMRQILVNHAKRHKAAKRAGGIRVTLEEAAGADRSPAADMIALAVYCKKFVSESVKFSGGLRERKSLIDQYIELRVDAVQRLPKRKR
jgi:RNA polymerase sigma factor (TIGR02999 family)